MATITTKSGETFKVYAGTILFDQVTSGFGPIRNWHSGLILVTGNILPFTNISSLELTSTGYSPNVRITTTNGKTIDTTIVDDSYFWSYIYGLNRLGVFRLSIEKELQSISFNWHA